ncbi:MAG: hypothetical protein AAF268_16190 [Cyanobacteria bacterium P01_A01_bin.3]
MMCSNLSLEISTQQRSLQQVLLKSAIAAGALATMLLLVRPAEAQLVQDALVGAGGNAVYGAVTGNGDLLENALSGAATGAAVSATHSESRTGVGGVVQDAAVGAATNTVTGVVLGNGSVTQNAIGGAATGVLINVTKDRDLFGGFR